MVISKDKHSNVIDNIQKCKKVNSRNLRKNISPDNGENKIDDSDVAFLTVSNGTYEKENSNIILSPAVSTQDRCKLTSWSLPPNILQVRYNTL